MALLSTLLALPDDRRSHAERELVALARSAALGELAADIAHDVANPLFGVLGLVDLLLQDATSETAAEERLRLLRQAALEMKGTLGALLDYARPAADAAAEAELAASARLALGLVRHGDGRSLDVEERYPPDPQVVACPPSVLVQALLHLLLAARAGTESLTLEVTRGTVAVSPGAAESVATLAAARIAADHGGTLEASDAALTLRLPPA